MASRIAHLVRVGIVALGATCAVPIGSGALPQIVTAAFASNLTMTLGASSLGFSRMGATGNHFSGRPASRSPAFT
jgi:hypothetical protein